MVRLKTKDKEYLYWNYIETCRGKANDESLLKMMAKYEALANPNLTKNDWFAHGDDTAFSDKVYKNTMEYIAKNVLKEKEHTVEIVPSAPATKEEIDFLDRVIP